MTWLGHLPLVLRAKDAHHLLRQHLRVFQSQPDPTPAVERLALDVESL